MNPLIDEYGNERWHNELGQLHRTDGPAVIHSNGDQFWYLNGMKHRTDGPAVIFTSGYQIWHLNGHLHRTNGPAIIYPNGDKQYWIRGNRLTEDEFNDIIQDEEHLNWYLLKIL